jgi:hypothetical protein
MNKLFLKIKFFLKKPGLIIITGNDKKIVKEMLFRVLKKDFKMGKDVFVFEIEEKKINELSFFIKNSKLPVLIMPGDKIISFKNIPANINLILNYDNEKIREINGLADFKKIKFGLSEKADVFVSDLTADSGKGINFKINHKGSTVPFWINSLSEEKRGLFSSWIYPVLSVVCAGIIFDLNLVEISEALKELKK